MTCVARPDPAVVTFGLRWSAECPCGWTSSQHLTSAAAMDAYAVHACKGADDAER